MIGEGIKSTNQRKHSYVQDHIEVASSPTRAFASVAKHVKSLARNGTRFRMTASRGREILTTTPATSARRHGDMSCFSSKIAKKETRLRDRWVCQPIRNRTCPP